ncbi:MAG: hypothetical protein AVDCRST_MAG88-2085 [uncultured Thermomicrobiales bacterium]|uniref:Uncharacterized protein n=1 Tax=uncultured Thermomicrobiales bacterium TaxID=1645740 RepID=A0A6J4V9S3_9BACT|nr:MAG: hypothetical protein AVDCRST_MAG88-2085 [uncultured Thermomicrobiales bacterium]
MCREALSTWDIGGLPITRPTSLSALITRLSIMSTESTSKPDRPRVNGAYMVSSGEGDDHARFVGHIAGHFGQLDLAVSIHPLDAHSHGKTSSHHLYRSKAHGRTSVVTLRAGRSTGCGFPRLPTCLKTPRAESRGCRSAFAPLSERRRARRP